METEKKALVLILLGYEPEVGESLDSFVARAEADLQARMAAGAREGAKYDAG